ncbi:MAG: DNA alkylation repair protein [Lachnospiraceae bacterium]|nr:DNA alkylation repair protein [Lachnospiraceae bacterium]
MGKYEDMKKLFDSHEDKEKAVSMANYMKNQFDFYGIATPERKELYKEFIKLEKKSKKIDWNFLDCCYIDNHRELQYLVYDYLLALKQFLTFDDISKIKEYILSKSWWDTIDFLCKVIGDIGLRDIRVKELMLEWSLNDNIWIKRTSIQHQLAYKGKTDTELLSEIIINCMGTDEFFINKAIGWALREYSKTNAVWVSEFIDRHKDEMSNLSIKEGSKYIK